MSLHVFSLKCPNCSATLDGLNGDMTFTCAQCALAFSVTEEGLKRYPMVLRAPDDADTDGGLWLPFWEMQCHPEIHADRPERIDEYKISSRMNIFVKAFTLTNMSKIGNPGMFLTEG